MARIRSIKPEFWTDEDISCLSEPARLAAIGLLNHSDDEGYFKAHPMLVKAAIFPLSDPSVSIHGIISELSRINYIRLCTGTDGKQYGMVRNFTVHQKVNRPNKSKIKPLCDFTEQSVINHGQITYGTGNREQGTGSREQGNTCNSEELPAEKSACKSTEVFEHWKLVMNHPKAVLDEKRIKLIKKWLKAGYSPETLMDSITGYTKSPHHMGHNDSGTKYDSIELLLRDAGKIDAGLKHLQTVNNPGESNGYKTNSGLNRHEKLQQWSVDTTERLERELAALREQENIGISGDGQQEFIPYVSDVDS